jgi:predicted dehydrogenase
VLVEKPLATHVAEVDEIAALAQRRRLVAMVGHTFLFSPAVRCVKELIESGALGDIRYICSQRVNLGRIRSDVDALWNFAPHDVSIIQYWLGDPTPLSVVTHGGDYIQHGIADVAFLHITYPHKVTAHVHVSWLDPRRLRCMVVVGTRKMVIYDDSAEQQVAVYDKGIDCPGPDGGRANGDGRTSAFIHRSGDVLLPRIDRREPLSVEVDHFVDCIRHGGKCLTGPEHARTVVHILASAAAPAREPAHA